ncbi:hypothetical protein DFH27DRAFT_574471 [Peziza echinospora]|nr:hypothetical protein DFH27DRAFT_574471 [Peziza echinospora]
MIFSLPILLAGLAVTVSNVLVSAQYPKPVLANYQYDKYYDKFMNLTKKVEYDPPSIWEKGHFPQACVDEASRTGCPLKDMKVYAIKYKDCDRKWNICRCGNPDLSLENQVELLGKMPQNMRAQIRHFMAFPKSQKLGWLAYAVGPDFVALSKLGLATMFHEVAHVIDSGRSNSDEWKNAVKEDTCVLTGYSNTASAENFAELAPLIFLEVLNKPDFEKLTVELKNFECMKRQLAYARKEFTPLMKLDIEKCPARKHEDSKAIYTKMERRDSSADFEKGTPSGETGWTCSLQPRDLESLEVNEDA